MPSRSFPQVAARSSVVHNALDHPHDAPPGGQPMPLVVVAAGHLREDKGFDVLIEAFRAVHARFPGARLLLAAELVYGGESDVLHRSPERSDQSSAANARTSAAFLIASSMVSPAVNTPGTSGNDTP